MNQAIRIWILAALWLAVIVTGFGWLAVHQNTPGAAVPGRDWPVDSRLVRAPDRLTLILFAHPKCPCTPSSLDELAQLAASTKDSIAIQIVFWQPDATSDAWQTSATWHQARSIAGASVVADPGGEEARRFGATTSGHTYVFAADGRLLFCGGITGARGHVGMNAGRRAIADLAAARSAPPRTPVFGCPLNDE